jgi:hypothetical protein
MDFDLGQGDSFHRDKVPDRPFLFANWIRRSASQMLLKVRAPASQNRPMLAAGIERANSLQTV